MPVIINNSPPPPVVTANINDIVNINDPNHPAGRWNGGLALVVRLSADGGTVWVKPAIYSPIYRMVPAELTVVVAADVARLMIPQPQALPAAATAHRNPQSEIDGGPPSTSPDASVDTAVTSPGNSVDTSTV